MIVGNSYVRGQDSIYTVTEKGFEERDAAFRLREGGGLSTVRFGCGEKPVGGSPVLRIPVQLRLPAPLSRPRPIQSPGRIADRQLCFGCILSRLGVIAASE